MLRLVLWLFAAVSLGDFAPAGEFSRLAASGSGAGGCACDTADFRTNGAAPPQLAFAADERPLPPAIVTAEPALDGEDGRSGGMPQPQGRTPAAASIVAAQLPDGRPSTAFNSRAPPADA